MTEPVWVGAARYVQYEVTSRAAPVSDVRLACVQADVAGTAVAATSRPSTRDGALDGAGALGAPAAAPLGRPAEPRS